MLTEEDFDEVQYSAVFWHEAYVLETRKTNEIFLFLENYFGEKDWKLMQRAIQAHMMCIDFPTKVY